MTEQELRHAVGDRVYDAFAPHGLLVNHDAEDPDNLAFLGTTDQGEEVEINKRAAESDLHRLRQHQPRVDGRRLEVHRHRPGQLPQPAPPPQRAHHAALDVVHGPARTPSCTRPTGGWARCCSDAGVKVFQIETTMNNDVFGTDGPMSVLQKREWEWNLKDRLSFARHEGRPRPDADAHPAVDLPVLAGPARHDLGAGRRGRGRARAHHRQRLRPAPRPGRGPDRHPHHGAPLHQPLQRQLDPEPDPGGVPRARLLLQPLPRQAAGARGRRADHEPPHPVGVPPGAPPELHRLLRAGPRRDHRPDPHRGRVREGLRRGRVVPAPVPDELRLPRRPPLLHVVLVRPRPPAPRAGHHRRRRRPGRAAARASSRPPPCRTRWRWRPTWSGRDATITHIHNPPILMADVT